MKVKRKLIPKQSDITIDLDGTVNLSFLWDDLATISGISNVVHNNVKREGLEVIQESKLGFPKSFQDEYQNCKLCPISCGVNRLVKSHPLCGDYKLRVSNSGISLGDEDWIRGERGSGIIMLSGCPLKCRSCHNPEKVHSPGLEITIDDFIQLAVSLYKQGAENIQIISPTVHFPALVFALTQLKRNNFPLPIILKTSGYDSVDQLIRFDHLVDIFVPDLKFGMSDVGAIYAKAPNYFDQFIRNIRVMLDLVGKPVFKERVLVRGVMIRHILSPHNQSSQDEIRKFLKYYEKDVLVSIMDNFVCFD